MESVKVYLLDKTKSDVQYGLNWGQRESREPNQAYLQLEPDIYKGDFFPKKGKYFIVDTDDHTTLIFNRAQKTADGCALHTPENNSTIGLYLRKRLGIANGAEITRDAILNYGKLDIDVCKVDDLHYLLNFSKDWKTKDLRYLFEQYLLIHKHTNNWKEAEKLSNNISAYSDLLLKKNVIDKEIFETNAFQLLDILSQQTDKTQYPAISLFIEFLKSDFFNLHYGEQDMKADHNHPSTGMPLQLICYGAPGTGKSHHIDEMIDDENAIRTTFHPDTDYATFVGAYKPTMELMPIHAIVGMDVKHARGENGEKAFEQKIIYKYVPQAFLKAYVAAWSNLEKPFYLVIEEINRGNCAQIFGDLFQLLDRNNMGCSSYPIHADEDIQRFLASDTKGFAGLNDEQKDAIRSFSLHKDNGKVIPIGEELLNGTKLLLPPNLRIWATMNTSDQSLFPIDSAFKRRWDWKYMPISNAKKDWVIEIGENRYDWWTFLKKINEKIDDTTHSEDKKLGYFFCKTKDGIISAETFTGKVIFYLWNDVFKDYEFSDAIFNDENGGKLTFDKFHTTEGCESKVVEGKIVLFLKNLGVATKNESGVVPVAEDEDGNLPDAKGKNFDKFTVNDGPEIAKKKLAYECIKKFIELHPDMPAEEVYNTWASLGDIVPHFVETAEQYYARTDSSKRSYPLDCAGTKIYVAWNGYGNPDGKADLLMDKVNNQNWGITIRRIIKPQND